MPLRKKVGVDVTFNSKFVVATNAVNALAVETYKY